MKTLIITLLLITINTYAQEQKVKNIHVSELGFYRFGGCDGINTVNNIPSLTHQLYSQKLCLDTYLEYDICNTERDVFLGMFNRSKSIVKDKIVVKDSLLREYKGQCDSWLDIKTVECKAFIKTEATKCGGSGDYYSANNNDSFSTSSKKTDSDSSNSSKNFPSYNESVYKNEQEHITAQKEREKKAILAQEKRIKDQQLQAEIQKQNKIAERRRQIEQQRQAEVRKQNKIAEQRRQAEVRKQNKIAEQRRQAEAEKLAKSKSSDYKSVCSSEIAAAQQSLMIASLSQDKSLIGQACSLKKTYQIRKRSRESCISNHEQELTQEIIDGLQTDANSLGAAITQATNNITQLGGSCPYF